MVIDPLKDYPGYALRRASAANMTKLARKFLALDLRPTEASVLMLVDANPGITQSEIGRMLDIASANMTPLASRLVDRKLLERQQVDGRSHGLILTGTGRALAAKAKKAIDVHEEELLSKIPATQRRAFVAALHALWGDD